jgi:hypothetical protein
MSLEQSVFQAEVLAITAQITALTATLQAKLALAKAQEALAALEAVPSVGRLWSVSDCHSHSPKGSWAKEATESGSYGVCVSSSFSPGANRSANLYDGSSVEISKRRFTAMKDIRIGDTLYMGDLRRKAVFRGRVTGQATKGFFHSDDLGINSFRRRVQERAHAEGENLYNCRNLSDEVEMMWEVKWERVGALDDAWMDYLKFSNQSTVRPLAAPPSF